jgi:hypothetical protein
MPPKPTYFMDGYCSCRQAWHTALASCEVVGKCFCIGGGQKKIRKAIQIGPYGQLDPIREELLVWIFEQHEQGIFISMDQVMYKVSVLLKVSFGI